MADGVHVRFALVGHGIQGVVAGLEPAAERIVQKAAQDLEAEMKGRVPVDTGTLKNSIQAVKIGAMHWQVVVGAEYGMYVEYGTARMAAQPFFHPAIQMVGPGFLAAMRQVAA